MAEWADQRIAVLTEPLEEYRKKFGCYPQYLCGPKTQMGNGTFANYRRLPSPKGFPGPSPNLGSVGYVELDMEDYILGVTIRVAKSTWSFSPQWKSIGVLTTGKGCVREVPPFLPPRFSFFQHAGLLGSHGRWSFWSAESQSSPRAKGTTVGHFLAALTHEDASVRTAAASALGRSRSEDAVEPLITTLSDKNATVRSRAAWALGRLGDHRALEALTKARSDPDPGVRKRAVWAVDMIGESPGMTRRSRSGQQIERFKD